MHRTHAVLELAREKNTLVRVPAPVLAEVCRGKQRDAAVFAVLNARGIRVLDLTGPIARHAGCLLEKAKLTSTHAIDAFVVATAASLGASIIATHDPKDLGRLAVGEPSVRIFPLV